MRKSVILDTGLLSQTALVTYLALRFSLKQETYRQELTEVFGIIRKGLIRFRESCPMDPESGPALRIEAS
jgi:hypothetical protein